MPERLRLHDRLASRLTELARRGESAAIVCALGADPAALAAAGAAIFGTWGEGSYLCTAAGETEALLTALRSEPATAALGVARFPDHGLDPAELMRAAARAAREAPAGGLLEASARAGGRRPPPEPAALAEGRVMLHYQPQVGLADGRIHGLEALMRILSSNSDGPEEDGAWVSGASTAAQLSEALLRWTFARARADLEGWRLAGLEPVWVAINLPLAAFSDDALTDLVIELTADEGEAAGRFEIELTEEQPPGDLEAIARNLARLRAAGPRVSLDDVGSGFAAVSLLERLPLDAAKIDRAFVAGLPGGAEEAAVVRAILARAHARGLTVIGEGVELPEQRALLAELGCDLYQGYVFSPPVSAEAVARLLRA